jgi:hypothetical protein
MPCPMHSYDLQTFCLSRFSCPFLQRKAPSRWLALIQKAHPSTSNTPHFETYVRRILVYILLIVMESLLGRAHLIKKGRDSSCLHQVAGRMPGIETDTDQLACLVAQIETEAFECPSAPCSWVCPAGDKLAGLMRDIVPSHLGDERTDISSMGFEPPVVKDMKPHVSSDQQKESSAKR